MAGAVAGRPAETGDKHHSGDDTPPIAGHLRPEALLGDKGYDSYPNHETLHKRRVLSVISHKGFPNTRGLGKLTMSSSRPSPRTTTSNVSATEAVRLSTDHHD